MTLACEDAYSKVVALVTVADVSLTFVQTLSSLVKILKLKFRRDFEAEVWSVFCCWCLVDVTKLNLGQYSEARFGQDFNFRFSRDADVWLRF